MADLPFTTLELHGLLDRWRAGDVAAGDELCRRVAARLEVLARKMIGGFPNVRPLADTGDLLQTAMIRLLRTLTHLKPESTHDFFNLAAVHLRRELLDLTRRVAARPELRSRSRKVVQDEEGESPLGRIAEPSADSIDLDRWCRFHEAVEALPILEREVIGLAFYHGWTQTRMAELFHVDERTIRRWWRSACARLHESMGGDLPDVNQPA
ncbi:MAG: RNA polymerase sigma factor [Isosphaeraceae bacterium]